MTFIRLQAPAWGKPHSWMLQHWTDKHLKAPRESSCYSIESTHRNESVHQSPQPRTGRGLTETCLQQGQDIKADLITKHQISAATQSQNRTVAHSPACISSRVGCEGVEGPRGCRHATVGVGLQNGSRLAQHQVSPCDTDHTQSSHGIEAADATLIQPHLNQRFPTQGWGS